MSNDIVTRLRMQAELTDAFPAMKAKDVAPTTWVNEAADEIERLRKEVARLSSFIHPIGTITYGMEKKP